MNFEARRLKVAESMKEKSLMILYSGVEIHVSADAYAPVEVNKNFFYLTGLRRENMVLVLDKTGEEVKSHLFIEPFDPDMQRWYGKRVTMDEAREISGIKNVHYIDEFDGLISRFVVRNGVENFYFDCYRHDINDLPDYNLVKANEFAEKYRGIPVINIFPAIAKCRMVKDADEAALIKAAGKITEQGLNNVMSMLEPGMKEYQAQANFEYTIKYCGADGPSFPTIAGSGINGTMLHYETNLDTCEDGTLLLLDLGARYKGYCADVTRTYPVNGKFTDRQRKVYDVVLKANKTVAANAKAGMTLLELNNICKESLAEGLIGLGLIKDASEVGKYYMHGVSHHLGIDVHDVTAAGEEKLRAGAVITDEPGLYIDEWGIGIRIEDDLLIGENGCEVLTTDIIREADEIEAFMAARR